MGEFTLAEHPIDHQRYLIHHGIVEGELRFLQQQKPLPLLEGPHQPNETQSTIGELFLPLPSPLGAPMLITGFQMKNPVSLSCSKRSSLKSGTAFSRTC